MSKTRLLIAGAFALASSVAFAQAPATTSPGGGAKMNMAPSGDAMSDKSSPSMKTPGMAAPKMKKHHARMKHHKGMKKSGMSKTM